MKLIKSATLFMSLGMIGMSLCACSNEPEPVSSDINIISTQGQNTGATESSGASDSNTEFENFYFVYEGCYLVENEPYDKAKLPEYDDVMQAASCAGPGIADIFFFKNGAFEVEFDPDVDVIKRISVSDGTVTTAEGIYIGNSIDKVKEVYGEPSMETDYVVDYYKGSSVLRFELKDGTVQKIHYMIPQN